MQGFVVITAFVVAAVVCLVLALLNAFLGMLAWNYLVPLTHMPNITFWQAYAACVLLSVVAAPFRTNVTTKGDK